MNTTIPEQIAVVEAIRDQIDMDIMTWGYLPDAPSRALSLRALVGAYEAMTERTRLIETDIPNQASRHPSLNCFRIYHNIDGRWHYGKSENPRFLTALEAFEALKETK